MRLAGEYSGRQARCLCHFLNLCKIDSFLVCLMAFDVIALVT
jgi:hypothetical protein